MTDKENKKRLVLARLKNSSDYVSGEELSNILNISRTAIWKYIQDIRKDGYLINSSTKKGYQIISSPDKVSAEELSTYLDTNIFGKNYNYFETLDSTNTTAKILAEQNADEGTVVLAEQQLAGKGRMGRHWVSPYGMGLYFSIIIRPKIPVNQASQLTLVIAAVIAQLLNNKYNIPAKIKWPNDILVNGKKVCGILVEMSSDIDRINYAVIGIGINVNNNLDSLSMITTNLVPTSLLLETGLRTNRAQIFAELLNKLENAYIEFIESGFEEFKQIWETYAYSIGRLITVETTVENYKGILSGIDKSGALILNINGQKKLIYSGEIVL